jgi:hypothetical protein
MPSSTPSSRAQARSSASSSAGHCAPERARSRSISACRAQTNAPAPLESGRRVVLRLGGRGSASGHVSVSGQLCPHPVSVRPLRTPRLGQLLDNPQPPPSGRQAVLASGAGSLPGQAGVVDGDQQAFVTKADCDLETMSVSAPRVPYGVPDKLAGDEPSVIERPGAVVDLGQRLAHRHRSTKIAGHLDRQ